jgi:23S rRNA (uracil1939-C5)-methyltransferase
MTPVVPLEIESIAAGGDGVARRNGLVVFVPRTAPGDLITARVSGKGTFARGSLRALTRPSPDRIEPACRHYTRDRCGGCQLQHLTYEAQLKAKQRIIRDALERIGKRGIPLPEVRPSPTEWRYRTKLTLAIRRNTSGGWIAGLHQYDDPSRVFALEDCPITSKTIVAVWREILAHADLFPESPSLRGSVRIWEKGAAFVLSGGTRFTRARELFDAVSSVTAMWWEDDSGLRQMIGDRRAATDRESPVASFAQVNPPMAAELLELVMDKIVSRSPTSLVDAYSGAGEVAIELAARGIRVTAIELDPDASAWCASRLPEGSAAVCARVEDALGATLPADVLLLNPPRAGVDERVCALLEAQSIKPHSVIYVSCNPATLARDLSRLPSYRIGSVTGFDMFPQTAHVETVAELEPAP